MTGLHVEVRGDGPPVVLLHGWGLNVRVWDTLAESLGGSLRLIGVDLPGHGQSAWRPACASLGAQVAWIRETVTSALGDSPYTVLGWSLGAQLALEWAATASAQLARLVLFAATPRFMAAADWPYGAPESRLVQLAEDLRRDYRRTIGEFLELQVRGSAAGEAALGRLRTALFAHGEARPAALAAGLDLLMGTDLRPAVGRIAAPALLIAGQYDRVLRPAASRALAQAMPHARYAEIRRAAHAPFLSHPDEIAALVADFLGTS